MEETIVYEPKGPPGSSDMRQAQAQVQTPGGGRYTYSSGARPLDGYTIKRAIGRGGFGEVYFATSDSGKEVALKLVLRNLEVERRGVEHCMNLKCPNLLTIYDMKENDEGDTFVVMEYVVGPSLANVIKQNPGGLSAAEVRRWLKGLVEGVAYLHDHGIVHRDLKPANLFMEEGIVKIGDYGLAKLIAPSRGTEHSESIGTCHYMAPEIGSGKYGKPIDIYAIGVILYEMLTGRVPFEGETVNEVLMKHLTARPDLSPLSEPFRSIVARALAKTPEARPKQVYDLLPPGEAPKEPEVRIIGENNGHAPGAPADDVYRIEAEEPVFYIGPETRPPRRSSPSPAEQVRAYWRAVREKGRAAAAARAEMAGGYRRRVVAPTPRPAARPAAAPVPPPPPPPPEPVPMPSGRIRLAELATSMITSALVLGALMFPATAALEINPDRDPQQIAYVYLMALLGAWASLIPAKAAEGRRIDPLSLRMIAGVIGWGVGLVGVHLFQLLAIDLPSRPGYAIAPLYLMPYAFAATFAATAGWRREMARDRESWFRIRSVFWSLLASAVAGWFLWPYARQDEIAIFAMIAVAVQVVSPRDEAAAIHARYIRSRKGRPKAVRV